MLPFPRSFSVLAACLVIVALVAALPVRAFGAEATTAAPPPDAAAAPAAETTAPPVPDEAAPPAAEQPSVTGLVTGDNVIVRHGPGTQYPRYYVAAMGTEVKVVGRDGGWLEIEFPAQGFSWIFSKYVSKIDENTGLVTGSEVNVRSGPGEQFDEIYRVQANHKFKILGVDTTGDWYHVEPMPGATAWISADYVRLTGPIPGEGPAEQPAATTPVTTAARTPAGAPSAQPAPAPGLYAAKMTEADEAFKSETAKENPADWDIEGLQEKYTEIADKADDAVLRVQARAKLAQLKSYASIKARAMEIGKVDDDLQKRLNELEKERQQTAGAAAPGASPYLATGKLERFYIPGIAGATNKLVDSTGSILYLLRSDVINLAPYEGKMAGVNGKIMSIPNLKVQMIVVTSAATLQEQ